MTTEFKAAFFALLILNLLAAVIGSHAYTAWSIKTRNMMYYFFLRRPINLDRAERADEIADQVVVWLRPLIFVLINLAWGVFFWLKILRH